MASLRLAVHAAALQPVEVPARLSATTPGIESIPFAARITRETADPLFEDVPPSRSGVGFQLRLPDAERFIQEIIHLSVYGGVCTGDFDGDGLPDLYVTSPVGGNKLYRNRGDFRFADVTESSGVSAPDFWGTGATFVDIDNDGDLDLYAGGYKQPNRLYVNQGRSPDGHTRFIEKAAQFGLAYQGASMMMAFADFDNDGDLDGYLATTALPPPPGVRFRVNYVDGKPVVPPELREYWAMLYLPDGHVQPTEAGQLDHLYRNDGGHFTEITQPAGITGANLTLAAIWWDYNNDGWPDLYVANDYLGADQLYRNNRDGTFTDVIRDIIPHTPWSSMGMDIADLNNDGRVDLMATDMLGSTHYRRQVMVGESSKSGWFLDFAEPRQYTRSAVYLNTGGGRVFEAAYQMGVAATDWTWGPHLEDYDNDGLVDVFVANGMLRDVQHTDLAHYADRMLGGNSARWAKFWAEQPMQKETNLAFRNRGDLHFERVEKDWGLARSGVSFGVATADFDNDGHLDLAVSNADAPLSLYRNQSTTGNSVRVRLKGTAANRFGIGAKVTVKASGRSQTRYLTLARSWLSASEPVSHFGLANADRIEQLAVDWPGGERQVLTNLPANQLHVITEPPRPTGFTPRESGEPAAAAALFAQSKWLDGIGVPPVPFDDFAREPLLPRKISQRAFCMAWGDADGDGREDLFLGGVPGQAGRLWTRRLDGSFVEKVQPAFAADKDAEDTAAIFFDFDGDKDLDLFVVSGGGREAEGHASYRDRLYLNDGKGNFTRAADGVLPDLRESGSCVAAADFDRDGHVDLFVGGYSIPGKYPMAAASRVLINRDGKLIDATPPAIREAGLVTDAIWSDADGDGWLDLLVTVEWGPVRFFHNESGRMVERTKEAGLQLRTGWWNAIAAGDVDGDGDVDFIVGNQGLNSRYSAKPDKPELLFYGDWSGAGAPQILEAHFEGEFGYPHRGLDALSLALPTLKEKFPTFDAFARAPIEGVFSMDSLRRASRREANTLESGVLLNDGKAHFQFVPLPALAQIAPARGVALADLNGDGKLDLVIAQNDYSPHREIGQLDGGVSLVLLGDGKGTFEPLWPDRSGVSVAGEAKRLAITDLDRDGKLDLVFATGTGSLRAYLNQSTRR